MSDTKKPSFWTRVRWVFTGKPVSHEEYQAARSSGVSDPMTQTQLAARNQRYQSLGMN
jgi:hypothetical protein